MYQSKLPLAHLYNEKILHKSKTMSRNQLKTGYFKIDC